LGEGALPDGVAAAEGAALGVVDPAGEWLAVVLPPEPPHAEKMRVATTAALMVAAVWVRLPIRKRTTTFCAPGYVSGTMHALKKGAALTLKVASEGVRLSGRRLLSVLFYLMEE
jgi:hypothetical protein